jgi:lysophospholipase L1-like esterase
VEGMAVNKIKAKMLQDLGQIDLDTGIVDNFYTWTTTEGQTNFIIPNGRYKLGSKTLEVIADLIPVLPESVTEISETEFQLDEAFPAGITVFARWKEFTYPAGSVHKDSHYAGAYDALDVTKLEGYDTQVKTPINTLQTDVTSIKAGGYNSTAKENVATTQGRFWQGNTEQLNSTIGGEKRQIKTVSTTGKKRIVLLGSSSAQGNGVADYTTTSFWALLKTKLEPKGYEILNRGFSADDTADGIGRFYRDVITANPDFVIIAFTIGNEGITSASDKYASYQQFRAGILRMCYMAKTAGITPILMNQAPTKSYTVEIYNYSQKLNAELDALGIHCVSWGGAVDALTGDGQPILSIMYDNVHYKEAAHTEIANAFPPTLFERAQFEDGSLLSTKKGSISTNTLAANTPMAFTSTDITTFSQFMRFKVAAPALVSVMSQSAATRVFMDAGGQIIWNDGSGSNVTVATGNYGDGQWHSVGVTYSPIDQKVRIYIDGVLKYTTTMTLIPNTLGFAGRGASSSNLKNAEVKDMAVWRTRLNDLQMSQTHNGVFSQTSLEVYSPGHDKILAAGMPLVNLAPTLSNIRIDPTETALTSTANPTM